MEHDEVKSPGIRGLHDFIQLQQVSDWEKQNFKKFEFFQSFEFESDEISVPRYF